ncbi:MAG TPA: hypothetical protein VF527_12715 [Pyrinomonadaceae bacterium]|jgi:hypothetical protein
MSTERNRIWQGSFLAGILVCALAGILAFGLSALSAFISIGSIVAGILNGLFYRPNAGDAGTSWLLARLTHALSVNKFLKAATALLWVASLTLGLFGANQAYIESIKSALEAKKITIEGLVLTAGGDPADNAVVTLSLSQRQEVVTAPGGKFTFSKIDLSDEPLKTVRIQARWRTHEGEIFTDLANGSPRGLIIKLPPGDPPIRISYFTLEGYAVDFLVHNKMNAEWEEKLGGQPFIVPNDVSVALTDLIRRFNEEPEGLQYLDVENKGKRPVSEPKLDEPFNERLFTGSAQGTPLYMTDPTPLIRSLEDPRQSWRVFYSKDEEGTAIESLIFRKFISRSDLDFCADSPFKNFYKYITREYMPPDFAYANVYFESEGCGDDDTGIKYAGTSFVGRSLGLRVAVVENISKDAISLDSFTVRVNRAERLRNRKEDKAALEAQTAEKQDLFPQKMLNPGEKIVVPTELPLSYKKEDNFYDSSSVVPISSKNRGRLVSELQQIDQINFPIYEKQSAYIVSARTVESILDRPGLDFKLNTEYLYGPSFSIESVEVDKVSYPFRQLDPAKIVIRNGAGMGSCPYIYTAAAGDDSWFDEGVILYGVNRKSKEKTVEMELTRFDGRVLIREKDPEDSFLDAAYIKAIFPDGRETILYPQHRSLRAADGNYLKLRQGEEIIIDFNPPPNLNASQYLLGMTGYYVPHRRTQVRQDSQSSQQRPTVRPVRLRR